MKILFDGYYGFQNTGDDAFIETVAWGANAYWGISNLKFLAQNIPQIKTKVKHTGKSYFKYQDLLKVVYSVFISDVLIFAGGSTFHSLIRARSVKGIALTKKKYFPQYKIGAIGVSLGPYRSVLAEKENIKLLKQFDFLALRDKRSFEIASSYNLPYLPVEAFDLAALLPMVYSPKKLIINKLKILGVSLCNYEQYQVNGDLINQKRRNSQLESLLLKIAKNDNSIIFRFFVFNGHPRVGDDALTLNIAGKIKAIRSSNVEVVKYNPNTFSTWSKIRECKVMLSTRLHGAIFACFADVPFFLVEYHRKCTDFLKSVGYREKDRIFDADFEINKFTLKIIGILNDHILFDKPTQTETAIQKAVYNFTKVGM